MSLSFWKPLYPGLHRLEAENLHRAELTAQERSDQIAEWVRLVDERAKVLQITTPGGQQPSDKGVRKAAKELGLDASQVSRANKIASLSEEAKEAAKEAGFDDNQSVLLKLEKANSSAIQFNS